jgi:hypothetical protein
MALIQRLLDKIRRKPLPSRLAGSPGDILIDSGMGTDAPVYVPEGARLQAEANMRLDPAKRAAVLALLTKKAGGDEEAGRKEFRRRYPRGGL